MANVEACRRIERRTGRDLWQLRDFDGFSNAQAATGGGIDAVIRSRDDARA